MAQWNRGQGASLRGIPLTAIAGDGVTIPGVTNPYVSPSDGVIGIQSAQAVGLDTAGVIPELSCFAPVPDVHTNILLPLFPSIPASLISDQNVADDVEQTLDAKAPATTCPQPQLLGGVERPPPVRDSARKGLTVPLTVVAPALKHAASSAPGIDAVVVGRGTQATCNGQPLPALPFFDDSAIQVILKPSCPSPIRLSRPDSGVLLSQARDTVTLRVRGRRVLVHISGPDHVRRIVVAVKRGQHFVAVKLNRHHSVPLPRGTSSPNIRVTVSESDGRRAVAVVTLSAARTPTTSPSTAALTGH